MSIIDLDDGIGTRRGRARRAHRRDRREERRERRQGRRAQRRAERSSSEWVKEFVGMGAALELAAGASGQFTVRAQRDMIPVAVYFGSTVPEDCTITTWTISGKNVLRGAGEANLRSFHPKNTTRPGFAFPNWGGGSDMIVICKNNHASLERVITGGVLVLRRKGD